MKDSTIIITILSICLIIYLSLELDKQNQSIRILQKKVVELQNIESQRQFEKAGWKIFKFKGRVFENNYEIDSIRIIGNYDSH
jgi:hypothetical protein